MSQDAAAPHGTTAVLARALALGVAAGSRSNLGVAAPVLAGLVRPGGRGGRDVGRGGVATPRRRRAARLAGRRRGGRHGARARGLGREGLSAASPGPGPRTVPGRVTVRQQPACSYRHSSSHAARACSETVSRAAPTVLSPPSSATSATAAPRRVVVR